MNANAVPETATSPPAATTERAYYCVTCRAFLFRSTIERGVIRDVRCRACRKSQDVYLGGRQEGAGATNRLAQPQ